MASKSYIFRYASTFHHSQQEVFEWHERPGAFARLNAPWAPVKIIHSDNTIKNGSKVTVKVPISETIPLYTTWKIIHDSYQPHRIFRDRLERGPFSKWEHSHIFTSDSSDQTFHEDEIEFKFLSSIMAEMGGKKLISSELSRLFKYRHQILANDLDIHKDSVKQKIAVSGSSGFIGSSLIPFLTTGGHQVIKVVRKQSSLSDEAYWNPKSSSLDIKKLESISSFIHLAGEGIADGKWSDSKKREIRESRIHGTQSIVNNLLKLKNPPKCFICASAIGIYGNSVENQFDENSDSGSSFLAETVRDWEKATNKLEEHGIRVVNLRFGIVLSPQGGALKKMLLPFLLGMGGTVGDGRQQMSWIALEDIIRIIYFCINNQSVSGPVNCTAPNPASNSEFTQTLAQVLNRPAIIPAPLPLLRLAYGQMVDETLLASQKVIPGKLADLNFRFLYPQLEPALRFCLGR